MSQPAGEAADIDRLRARLATNPFNQWLGNELVAAGNDEVEFRCGWRSEFVSNPDRGATHGGVLATLIDTAAIYAVIAATGRLAATIDLRVDYHSLAEPGVLRTVGKAIRIGNSISSAEAAVFDPQGKLVASGRGTFVFLATRI